MRAFPWLVGIALDGLVVIRNPPLRTKHGKHRLTVIVKVMQQPRRVVLGRLHFLWHYLAPFIVQNIISKRTNFIMGTFAS
ncbi:hypothetical protein WK32_16600 [Burkholderia vietnamiensis]|nr:hypothetical protein WK32_16600 [Burkholderia vietnamiensis]